MEIPPPSTREEATEENFGAGEAPSPVVGVLRNVWAKRRFLGKAIFTGRSVADPIALPVDGAADASGLPGQRESRDAGRAGGNTRKRPGERCPRSSGSPRFGRPVHLHSWQPNRRG